jgi:hypothetical protein
MNSTLKSSKVKREKKYLARYNGDAFPPKLDDDVVVHSYSIANWQRRYTPSIGALIDIDDA